MKKFLFDIIVFGIGFLILNFVVYYGITYNALYKEYEVEQSKLRQYSNFIFADSHGWPLTKNNKDGQIILDSLDTYNFSYGSDSYFDIYFKLEYLIKSRVLVDTVFLSVDDHMLSDYKASSNNRNRSIMYSSYDAYKKYFGSNVVTFYVRKYIIKYLPLLQTSNATLVKMYFLSYIKDIPGEDGYVSSWSKINLVDKERKCRDRINYFFEKENANPRALDCLNNIVDLCKKNKIILIGLKFPLPPTFISLQADRGYDAAKVLEDSNYLVIDHTSLLKSDVYFSNQDHMSVVGAIEFLNTFKEKKEPVKSIF